MQSSYIHIHNPDKSTLLDFLIYSFTSHFVCLVLVVTKHVPLASYKQKTRICLEWSDKENKPAELTLCLKTDIPLQMCSINILDLLFNEQVKLSLISGSVLDPYNTLWKLTGPGKTIEKRGFFQLFQLLITIHHAVTHIIHLRWVTQGAEGRWVGFTC